MKKIIILLCSVVLVVIIITQVHFVQSEKVGATGTPESTAEEISNREEPVTIKSGDTFSTIAETAQISPDTISSILTATKDIFDLATIRAGKSIVFVYDRTTNELISMRYEPSSEMSIVIKKNGNQWQAEKKPIKYEVRVRTVSGTIQSSLYETALEMQLDPRAIIALADIFAWQVDFAVDVRKGDSFSMIYEERYRDGKYVMPGTIRAAKFINDGTVYQGYFYKETEDREGYFDEQGNSLEKILLKAPLQYRYISSGYTGKRVNPITRKMSSHYAIDYAAGYGTPAVSVGDGTVVFAGWRTGYGNSVDVRHNETYTTRYGHFSKLAVRNGQKVKQGQIVGYVGSTGWSTGPHLHYEVHRNGSPVNPLTLTIPPAKGLSPDALPNFHKFISQFSL